MHLNTVKKERGTLSKYSAPVPLTSMLPKVSRKARQTA